LLEASSSCKTFGDGVNDSLCPSWVKLKLDDLVVDGRLCWWWGRLLNFGGLWPWDMKDHVWLV